MHALLMLVLATVPLTVTNRPAGIEHAQKLGLPIECMSVSNQELVAAVAEHCTLHRVVPPQRFRGQVDNFHFMLSHMELSGVLAERAGMISYRPKMSPDGRLAADNNQEAAGFLLEAYCGENRLIYYVEGTDKGSLAATGRGVVVVNFKQVTPTEVEYSGEVFVRIENGLAATLARMFFVFLKKTVDQHFAHIMRQPINLTQLITDNPKSLQTIIEESKVEDYQILSPLEPLLREPAR